MHLHNELLVLRKKEKQIGALILTKLQQMEVGRKYLSLGYSSLFDYLVRGLGYSESTAYQKQSCLRLTKEIPEIKQKLDSGQLNTSGISMAFRTLKNKSTEEKREILSKIENKPSREIKKILLQEVPIPAPPIRIEKTEYSDKVILRMELTKQQNQKLERLKALKSHSGKLEELLEKLIDQELKKFENTAFKPSRSKNSRQISKTLRNHTLNKAKNQCQFPGCKADHFLQIDHIHPISKDGNSSASNLQVLCSAHNQWKGAKLFDGHHQ